MDEEVEFMEENLCEVLSRTTSGLSGSTIPLADLHETSKIYEKHHVEENRPQNQREPTVNKLYFMESEPHISPKSTMSLNMQDFQERPESNGSSFSLEQQNLRLESLFGSMDRERLDTDRSGLLPEDRRLFQNSNNPTPAFQKALEQAAARYAENFAGKLVPVKVRFMNNFTFKCCLGHKFDLSSAQISANSWCDKCQDLWINLQKTAKKKDSSIINPMIGPQVNIRCMRNHLFTIKPSEKLNKWCPECVEMKKKHKEIILDKEAQAKQNALLQDSLRKYIQHNAISRSTNAGSEDIDSDALDRFKDAKSQAVFDEVKNLASIYLNKFLSERPELLQDREFIDENFDHFMWIYQILLLPQNILQELLFKTNEKQSKSNFRKLCILVHPDKNTHELASKAFQRLLSVFQQGSPS